MTPQDPHAEHPDNSDDDPALPPEILEVFRNITGGAEIPPEMLSMMQRSGIGNLDPAMLTAMVSQVQAMFAGGDDDDPVNRAAATDIARKTAAGLADPAPDERDHTQVRESVRVADLWLDAVSELPSPAPSGRAWSRAEWVEATMPVWCDVVAPVAAGVSEAVQSALKGQLEKLGDVEVPGLGVLPAGAMEQAAPMLRRIHGGLFSMQLGQGVGSLSAEVLTGCEMGLPVVSPPEVVIMPVAMRAFAEGLGVDAPQVCLFLAVREAARARLFAEHRWIAEDLLAAVRDYAADITIDTDAIESALTAIDPADPSAVQGALEGQLFAPEPSAAQRRALERLETSVALVEGWLDVVTTEACRAHLPQEQALAEAVRRRRASGGPAERTFAALVGLEVRPRRLRDAANLFAALQERGGAALRDGAWAHPDLAPGAGDLDDLLGYVERVANPTRDDLDAELDALLRGENPTA